MNSKLFGGVALAAILAMASACAPADETETAEVTAPESETSAPATVETTETADAGTMATPESVGFNAEKLQALDAQYAKMVEDEKLAGITWLVSRHGKIVLQEFCPPQLFGQNSRNFQLPQLFGQNFRHFQLPQLFG